MNGDNTSSNILSSLQAVLPLISEMTGVDMQISLCDTKKVLAVWEAKTFRLPGAKSDVFLSKENVAHKKILDVMREGRPSVDILPKELLGETIRGVVTPVFENGEVVGAVTCATSLRERDEIKNSSKSLFDNLSQAHTSIEEVAKEAVLLADQVGKIEHASSQVAVQINKARECISAIQSNAGRSNILALNGSIEAARMGEAGRGFAVIAQEMRKFSQVSNETSKTIIDAIGEASHFLQTIETVVGEVNVVATTQAASTEEITAALNDITEKAEDIVNYIEL